MKMLLRNISIAIVTLVLAAISGRLCFGTWNWIDINPTYPANRWHLFIGSLIVLVFGCEFLIDKGKQ